jgi:hypothetical protein
VADGSQEIVVYVGEKVFVIIISVFVRYTKIEEMCLL